VPKPTLNIFFIKTNNSENWYDLPGDTFIQKLIWLAGVGSLVYLGVRFVLPAMYTTGVRGTQSRKGRPR
jgi:hypothetical protein